MPTLNVTYKLMILMITTKRLNTILTTITLATTLALLSGCVIHKVEVQQGNVIPAEAVSQLKTGMSKGQVAKLLGTPLLVDSFQQDRWDYVFTFKDKNEKMQKQSITLFFQGNTLARISK